MNEFISKVDYWRNELEKIKTSISDKTLSNEELLNFYIDYRNLKTCPLYFANEKVIDETTNILHHEIMNRMNSGFNGK